MKKSRSAAQKAATKRMIAAGAAKRNARRKRGSRITSATDYRKASNQMRDYRILLGDSHGLRYDAEDRAERAGLSLKDYYRWIGRSVSEGTKTRKPKRSAAQRAAAKRMIAAYKKHRRQMANAAEAGLSLENYKKMARVYMWDDD